MEAKKVGRPKSTNVNFNVGSISLTPEDHVQWLAIKEVLENTIGAGANSSAIITFLLRQTELKERLDKIRKVFEV